jgi:transposase InsO family protein
MSWQEKDQVTLRKEFIFQAIKEGANISLLCRNYNISRKTGYKWLQRYEETGLLTDQSKRPHCSPLQTSEAMVEQIMHVRHKHSTWGARKIQATLLRQGIEGVPASSAIHKVLQRKGCIQEHLATNNHWQRFEHPAPNHLWQMDFKGHFAFEKGRCHPLTILDDHSRFSIKLAACLDEKRETVQPLLIEAFRTYGLPNRINVDNGQPWGGMAEQAKYTQLSVWLILLGIQVSYSRPYHPQTNGKDERFHRTLKQEVLQSRYFRDLAHIQETFNEWRDIYNLERPHEGINMQVPGDRYQSSYRPYSDVLLEEDYSPDYLVKRVDSRGRIHLEGKQLFVGTPFAGKRIGLRAQPEEDVMSVYFIHQKLGEVDMSTLQKNSITNLYSNRSVVI